MHAVYSIVYAVAILVIAFITTPSSPVRGKAREVSTLAPSTTPLVSDDPPEKKVPPKITMPSYHFGRAPDLMTPDEHRSLVGMGIMNTPSADGPGRRHPDPTSYFVPRHNTHSTLLAAYPVEESEGGGGGDAGNYKRRLIRCRSAFIPKRKSPVFLRWIKRKGI